MYVLLLDPLTWRPRSRWIPRSPSPFMTGIWWEPMTWLERPNSTWRTVSTANTEPRVASQLTTPCKSPSSASGCSLDTDLNKTWIIHRNITAFALSLVMVTTCGETRWNPRKSWRSCVRMANWTGLTTALEEGLRWRTVSSWHRLRSKMKMVFVIALPPFL